jgi:uncharacterized repeat protein (TIGR01451 family)
MKSSRLLSVAASFCAVLLTLTISNAAFADEPIVLSVPGDANNPTIFHAVISGRPVTLKGAVDAASVGSDWTWDPGDGSAPYTGVVGAAHWAVWAEHTYAGSAGDFYEATLTVDNGVDPVDGCATCSATFPIILRGDTVPNRANAAISEALWYMHRHQRRFLGDEIAVEGQAESTIPMGSWSYTNYGGELTVSVQGATLNAFEANGHRGNGDDTNPYTETVARGMNYLFARLGTDALAIQTAGSLDANPRSDDPDSNGNGIGISLDNRNLGGIGGNGDEPYQLGMVIDAIVASGTPGALATTGPADVIGRSYSDIVQDMVDWYAWAQSDSSSHGGWQYGAFNNTGGSQDNSASGWAATGITAAEDLFGATVPDWLKTRNQNGLEFTDNESDVSDSLSNGDGVHGYNNTGPIFGPYGTTGAALVQMSMNGIDATTSLTPDERWVRTENFFRRNFDNGAGTYPFKFYYYGLFNFTKAMRTAKPAPVTIIGTHVGVADDAVNGIGCGPNPGCAAGGPSPLDWYNDSESGIAAAVTSYQTDTGANIGQFASNQGYSFQFRHVQPWATQILTRTLAQAGPIAVGTVSPNPSGEGFPITLDHSRSFHQDPERSLVLFEWDIDNDGNYDLSSADSIPDPALGVPGGFDCVAAGGFPCEHTLNLRVTDDSNPPVTATDVVILDLTVPPHAPTADAGGPYLVCVGEQLALDGSESFDIDEGNTGPEGTEPDAITLYEWELDGVSPFDYAESDSPDDPTTTWTFDTVGVANIGLRVTDNSSNSYPTASEVDLTDTDNTFVVVANCVDSDLSVSAVSSDSNPIIPSTVTITVTVSNAGPDDVTDVELSGFLSNLITVNSITPSQGSCAATGVQTETQDEYSCDIGDIAAGTSVDIVIEFFTDTEGTAAFDFSVYVDAGQLLQLADPNESNNTISTLIVMIDEVIIVIAGKGKGSGAFGLIELLLLGTLAIAVMIVRRRRARATTAVTVGLALILMVAVSNNTAVAADDDNKGFYVGGGIGSASGDTSATSFADGLAAAGYNVSEVSLDDSATGVKIFVGYMFNEYVGVQGSYVDLGQLESEFTASVPPDQIDALLATSADLLPGRGKGWLADLVLKYPFSDRVSIYGTLGIFFSEPETKQTVVVGGSGTAFQSSSDNDFGGSIGLMFSISDRSSLRVGFEQYKIDGISTDFPMAAFSYAFGSK